MVWVYFISEKERMACVPHCVPQVGNIVPNIVSKFYKFVIKISLFND